MTKFKPYYEKKRDEAKEAYQQLLDLGRIDEAQKEFKEFETYAKLCD